MTRLFHGEPLDEKRSRHMATIKGKNTKPELALRRALWAEGLRYRIHDRSIPGTPDVSHKAARVAVFIDGCFWHGCPTHYTAPKSRAQYWQHKVRRNQQRRAEVKAELAGWRVLEFWECELRDQLTSVAGRVQESLAQRPAIRSPTARSSRPGPRRRRQ